MRSYIFTEKERRRLRVWLESGKEDLTTLHLFVKLRRNIENLAEDVELLRLTTTVLRLKGRMMGRIRPLNPEEEHLGQSWTRAKRGADT